MDAVAPLAAIPREFPGILLLRDDPKIVGRDDPEIASDSAAEEDPILRYCRSKELRDRRESPRQLESNRAGSLATFRVLNRQQYNREFYREFPQKRPSGRFLGSNFTCVFRALYVEFVRGAKVLARGRRLDLGAAE